MNAFRALFDGLHGPRKTAGIVAVLYGVNLVLAGLPALALHDALVSSYGDSQIASRFAAGFDFTAASDLLQHHGERLHGILQQFPAILVLSVLLNALLTGGVLRGLTTKGNDKVLRTVLMGVGEFAARFLRLLALVGCLAVVAAVLIFAGVNILWNAIAGGPTNELQVMMRFVVGLAGVAVALWIIAVLADYTRVRIVVEDERSVIRGFRRSFQFVIGQAGTVIILQLLLLAIVIAAGALYVVASDTLSAAAGQILLVTVLLQQAFVAARHWIRVVTSSSQIALTRGVGAKEAKDSLREEGIEAYRSRL